MAKSLLSATEAKPFDKECLLQKYHDITVDKIEIEKLIEMVKKSLVPFVAMGLMTEEEKKQWTEEDYRKETDRRYRRLIDRVIESKSLDKYIKFTRALTFRNRTEVKKVYHFFEDLFEVGLVDPLQEKSEVNLSPRSFNCSEKATVLWLVQDRMSFEMCRRQLPDSTTAKWMNYEILRVCSDFVDVHVTYPEAKPKAPGRKYNHLLAKYNPHPSFLVCTTYCILQGEEESNESREQVFLVSSVSQSKFDRTAEASHITQLCRFDENIRDFLSKVEVCVREATRYAGVQGRSVHCPDAANLHYAAKVSNIPAIAIARVITDQNNCEGGFYFYIHELIKRII